MIDWTWFVPGPTAMALVAGGFVAGRAPLGEPIEQSAQPGQPEHPGAPGRRASPRRSGCSPPRPCCWRPLLTAWAIWQPEAADRATTDAIHLAEAGELDAAIARTEDAADMNPLSSEPLLVQAGIETTAGRETAARDSLEEAVLKFPGEAQTWYQLALFQLGTLEQPRKAAATVQRRDLPRPAGGAAAHAVPGGEGARPRAGGAAPGGLAARARQQRARPASQRADVEAEVVEQRSSASAS